MGMVHTQHSLNDETPEFDPHRPAPSFGLFDAQGNSVNLYGVLAGLLDGMGQPVAYNAMAANLQDEESEWLPVNTILADLEARVAALEAP